MQYLRDVSEMSCGTTAIMQMRLQQDSSNSSRIVRITATSKFLDVIFFSWGGGAGRRTQQIIFLASITWTLARFGGDRTSLRETPPSKQVKGIAVNIHMGR